MIDLIQPAPVKPPVIADLQGLGLGDSPLHQGIAVVRVILAPMGFVGGNPDMVERVLLLLEPVDFLGHQVELELAGTPAYPHGRPAVAGQGLAFGNPSVYGPLLPHGGVEHQPLETVGMAQGGDVDASLPEQKIVQLGNVGLHLGELHACVGVEDAVDGHILLQHQQK